jgi:hypothetical protein
MKRLALVLLAAIGSITVKAQSAAPTPNTKSIPSDNKITYAPSDIKISENMSATSALKIVDGKLVSAAPGVMFFADSTHVVYSNMSVNELLKTIAAVNPDRMPIAKPANTDKRMPIVKTDRTAYNMPIVGNGKVKAYATYKSKSGADSVVVIK